MCLGGGVARPDCREALLKLLLLRHGPVSVPAGLCYGHLDVPLQEPSQQWSGTARQFIADNLDSDFRWWSSPLARAARMAEILAKGASVKHDDRLRELNFGDFEGRLWTDIPLAESLAWTDSNGKMPCPGGGESHEQLVARVLEWLHDVVQEGKDVCVVSHGGPMRALLQSALELHFAELFRYPLAFAAFALFECDAQTLQALKWNMELPSYRETLT